VSRARESGGDPYTERRRDAVPREAKEITSSEGGRGPCFSTEEKVEEKVEPRLQKRGERTKISRGRGAFSLPSVTEEGGKKGEKTSTENKEEKRIVKGTIFLKGKKEFLATFTARGGLKKKLPILGGGKRTLFIRTWEGKRTGAYHEEGGGGSLLFYSGGKGRGGKTMLIWGGKGKGGGSWESSKEKKTPLMILFRKGEKNKSLVLRKRQG